MVPRNPLRIAVVGAGPVGLALALDAARRLPEAGITLFDARPLERDVGADPRALALALGSVQWLKQLGAWPQDDAAPIAAVHVSQAPPSLADAAVRIGAADEGVSILGAVLRYGRLVAPMQSTWLAAAAASGGRLASCFGTPVQGLAPVAGGVEVDAGVVERFDLAVVAEGGVFGEQARKALVHDYAQTAWVGEATVDGGERATAFERFTRQGPAALLPLPPAADGSTRASLVWCVDARDDPVRDLADTQRLALLNTVFPPEAGRITAITPLKAFPLGLNAERTLVRQRMVRIGNAAQTLHPVAGQGLNLGLRDAYELVDALRSAADVDAALARVEWARAPDRWGTIATTDFLARSFTWRLPGLELARGVALAALQRAAPLKSMLARQMMFGWR
ncbi:MAG TPA: FAD-dependent monooxygenase [Rubrivivax sp.]|nr:FAD-dependent monooxygenase [Rubrivivax sp.]